MRGIHPLAEVPIIVENEDEKRLCSDAELVLSQFYLRSDTLFCKFLFESSS